MTVSSPSVPQQPKLLDRVRGAIQSRHFSRITEDAYVSWVKRFIFFHGKRHPVEMGEAEVTRFLSSTSGTTYTNRSSSGP
ncbi:MAG TPA: site-specific integrase [Candidatus Methylomirabilis sp.]|nr:site-specific integrase [Candidatus Methylomirabilis sp.]HSC72021.1 site-specific integrase [Candidatus Methylomirabilis sp.]